MREPSSLARGGPRLTGVIDTLSAGFGIVNRHPWLLLLPILLDVLLWQGPQVSSAPLIGQAAVRPSGLRGDAVRQLQEFQRQAVSLAEDFNLLSFLGLTFVAVPSVIVGAPGVSGALGVRASPLSLDSWSAALLIAVGSWFGGLLLGSLYHALVAQRVRAEALSLLRAAGQSVSGFIRMLLYGLVLAGVLAMFGAPILLMVAVAYSLDQFLAKLLLVVAAMGWAWMWIYLFFVPDAVFLSRVGPLQAIKNSVAVVRTSFWPAATFMMLSTLILLGMGRVWTEAAGRLSGPWGGVLAIVGNAYIASGLVAASMTFYQERNEAARASALSGSPQSPPQG